MQNTKIKLYSALTLVELIVVIVILAILFTIAFLSFSNQSSSARDSIRITDMGSIIKGISIFSVTSGKYPIPDRNINIMIGTSQIGYQGEAGDSIIKIVKLSTGGGKDPLDQRYYTYNTNILRNKAQLVGFLENKGTNQLGFNPFDNLSQIFAAVDYSNRYPYEIGDGLGIILAKSGTLAPITYTPIQNIIATGSGFDTQSGVAYSGMVSIINNSDTNLPKVSSIAFKGYTGTGQSVASDGFLKLTMDTGNISSAYNIYNLLAVDNNGNSFILNNFGGTVNILGQNFTSSGANDFVLSKLDNSGNKLWSKKGGGVFHDSGNGLVADSNGNAYLLGIFERTNINIFGQTLSVIGGKDLFLTKLDNSGNVLWMKQAGGTGSDGGNNIAVDNNGNLLVTGLFEGTANIFGETLTGTSYNNAFIAKLDSSGNKIWIKKIGKTFTINTITVDSNGNSFISGNFLGNQDIFGQNLTSNGSFDVFLTKLDSSGNVLWIKQTGGINDDTGGASTMDSNGNIYITGQFQGTVNIFGESLTSNEYDYYVAKLDNSGNKIWVKRAYGTDMIVTNSIAVDSSGNSYVTGEFYGTNLNIYGKTMTAGPFYDTYVAKLDSSGNTVWIKQSGLTEYYAYLDSVDVDDIGNAYVTGHFSGSGTINVFGQDLTSVGIDDNLLAKLNISGNY